jgi:guanylate kinase
MPRLVLLSGPSCVGKSPLTRALERFFPELAQRLKAPVLYNCRIPRPGERDGVEYHFRSREFLEELRAKDGYLVLDVRNDVQALALDDLQAILDAGQDAFFEGNPYIATALLDSPLLAAFPKLSVFLAPVSAAEVAHLQSQGEGVAARVVRDVMRRKLMRRTARQKGALSLPDLQDIEARCGAAWRELSYAWRFDWVLPNHDGEDSENWDAFYWPLGDARQSLRDFAALLEGGVPECGERWRADLIPSP